MVDITIGNFRLSWGKKSSVGATYDLKGNFPGTTVDDFSSERISERRALGLSAVYTCINVTSRTTASLPINIVADENNVKRQVTDHPAYYPLAHEPNTYMSSAQLFLTAMIHAEGWGNALIGIVS